MPVESPGPTLLGISFRPLQAEALGLDARSALSDLLAFPFYLIRLGAYWNRIEVAPGDLRFDALDWQIAAAEQAHKRIILTVGALKTFGYPEFFAPAHHLPTPLPEGALISPASHPTLLDAASTFVTTVIERYRDRAAIVAWQVEHEAVDPLGMEHSWRLARAFVQQEVAAARRADPTRPVMLNGFLPTSLPVRAQQWWRTRDQGDSLAIAQQLADIVGVDYYPRHALVALGPRVLYLDGSASATQRHRRRQLSAQARTRGQRLMISEGQAEPWETVTTPPSPGASVMASCRPEHVIENYNACMQWTHTDGFDLYAYLFWGAEYWLQRRAIGDSSYLRAFERILHQR